MYRHILALPLALLLGCGLAAPGPGPVDASPTILLAPTMPATPPVSDTSAPAVDAALPAGWQRVPWQGLSIPLPPEATGIEPFHTTTSDATHNLPLLASGMVAFPPPTPEGGAIGEYPLPPTFTLLEFPGTLADWIALEEQITPGEDGGVMEPIEPLRIAGREALHYQRTAPGFNYNDYYVLKVTDTTLLWIYTDAEAFGAMIDGLIITAP